MLLIFASHGIPFDADLAPLSLFIPLFLPLFNTLAIKVHPSLNQFLLRSGSFLSTVV
jgi:hypothetical protein